MRKKEKEEDLVSLMTAAGISDDEILTYLYTGKISQSIADKVFKGKVPDKYKDIIVSDKYFKKLIRKTNKILDNIIYEEICDICIRYEKIDYN